MPKCCVDCPCFYDFISCQALFDGTDDFSMSGFDEYKMRLPNCPLVEVPTPHGRLIDADAIIEVQMYDEMYEEWSVKTMTVDDYLADAADLPPTIIEAEERTDI